MKYFQKMKEIVDALEEGLLSTETLVTRKHVVDGRHMSASVLVFSDSRNSLHTQKDHDEILVIINGSVNFQVGEEIELAEPGDLIFIPKGVLHGPVLKKGQKFSALSVFGPNFDWSKDNNKWHRNED